ncbi:MAG: hypothetical protein H8M99_10645 [Gloeobacteraceae cyanobacterium ES-bin-144]|nr:hypothetical protein [Verrucomicrobiales bacterium]
MTLIQAELVGGKPENPAIISEGDGSIFVRDVTASGYGHTIKTKDGTFVDGKIDEWSEKATKSMFPSELKTLRLPIEETPEIPWQEDLTKWVAVDCSGEDDSDALQAAINQAAKDGKTTIYFINTKGNNGLVVSKQIRVHGSVNRIIGMSKKMWISDAGSIKPGDAVFLLENLKGQLVVERFFNFLKLGAWKGLYDRYLFENRSDHPVIIRNIAHGACMHKKPAPGKVWFIEDVAGARMAQFGKGERSWMRQYNPESPDIDMCVVDGGQVWILGLKTEGRARHIVATNGAKVELLGGVSYQSWKKQSLNPPIFTVHDSVATFTCGYYDSGTPFTTLIEERRGSETKTLPYKSAGFYTPLISSRPAK